LNYKKTEIGSNTDPAAPTHNAIELESNKRKRRMLPPPRLHGKDPIRIPFLKGLLDTYTDE